MWWDKAAIGTTVNIFFIRRIKTRTMANTLSSERYFLFLLCVSDLVFGQIRYSLPEELDIGAFVGNIAEDLRISVHELSTRKFQLLSNDGKQYFEVNAENGILFVNERIDREQLCIERSTCSISLELAVENPFEVFPVEVEILDVNDNSPIFPTSRYLLQLSELAAPGARFTLESAHDPDVGTNTISTYKISSSELFGLQMQTTNDGSKIAELLLEKPLDREKQSSFELVLTAVDGGIPQRSGAAQISITVADANDNAPVFDQEIYRTSVLENAPKGTLLMKINAADLDEGANAEIKYRFGNYVSQKVRELFNLDSETGEIRVKGLLDHENSDIYEIAVQAVDSAPHVGNAKVLVRIVDMNDNAPEIKLTSATKIVPEDAVPGSLIAVFSVTDRDSGENGHVRCQISMNMPFKLETTLSKQYKLVTSEILDRERTALYNVSISAWDAGSPALSANKTIVVAVSDINDNAPRFTESAYNVYMMENNTPGATIFSVTALDPDLDQNGAVSYSILENQIQDVSAPAYFTINSKSGSIYALRSFDYEQFKNFQIKVQAQDAGSPQLSSTAIVSVITLDQNDNAPLIISPLMWNSSAAVEIVPHSIYAGYIVTKVMAKDADSGQNARLSYELIEATDRSLFTLGPYSGEIRTTRSFTEQDTTTQRVVVLVKDNGQPSLSSTVTILFSIAANVTENPSERVDHPTHVQYFSDLNIYLIIIFGSTSFIFLVMVILLVLMKCKQDRNNLRYHRPTIYCCCMRSNSNDVFDRRLAPNESLNYYGAGQTIPVSDTYRYTIRLSPESCKSDFLFLKTCHPTLPLSDVSVGDTGERK
ncbi:protocadherin alpha-C2-like [Heptranchias perlo]|uniref:protocadherin alpha-C2-like n=1 Tax=Heptranchias perlo TaxID=212740 RepID=UPI00355A68F7